MYANDRNKKKGKGTVCLPPLTIFKASRGWTLTFTFQAFTASSSCLRPSPTPLSAKHYFSFFTSSVLLLSHKKILIVINWWAPIILIFHH